MKNLRGNVRLNSSVGKIEKVDSARDFHRATEPFILMHMHFVRICSGMMHLGTLYFWERKDIA